MIHLNRFKILFYVIIFIFFSTSVGALQKQSIKIAYIGGLTGRESKEAQRSLMALRLLVDDYNGKGGIRGRPIELFSFDNRSQASENILILKKIKSIGITAITGLHISNSALVVANVAEKEHLPSVIASATHPSISRDRKYINQVCFNDDFQGLRLARFVSKSLGVNKVALIVDVSDSASMRVSQSFSDHFLEHHGVISHKFSIRTNQQDFDSLIEKLQVTPKLGAIFIAASSIESSYLIKKLYENGVRLPFVGTDNWQNQDLSKALKNLDQDKIQAYFPAHWYLGVKNRVSKQFIRDFQLRYHQKLTSFDADAALTFDAGKLLFEAISRIGILTPELVALSIRKTSINGVTGLIALHGQGWPRKQIFFLKLINGQVVSVGERQ